MSFLKLVKQINRTPPTLLQGCRKLSGASQSVPRANAITLIHVPNLVTPRDIRRAFAGKNLQGVSDVQIVYKGFRPSGKAIIRMTSPAYVAGNLKALEKFSLNGVSVRAAPYFGPDVETVPRTRGARGIKEALERGVIDGNGPEGNFPNVEANVVLWGVPAKVTTKDIERALRDFTFKTKNGHPIIVKLEKPDEKFTYFSRFVVTMSSVSEARRLARAWNMTPWTPESPNLIKAQALF